MSLPKIFISVPNMQKDYSKIRHLLDGKCLVDLPKVKENLSEKKLLEIIDQYDGVICGDDDFTPKVINKAKKLRVIVKWGTGVDSINVKFAAQKGIPVYNTPNALTEPVADTALAYMLAFARNIIIQNDLMKKLRWTKTQNFSLSEKILGLIGYGNIGHAIAKRSSAFGMKIIACDITKNLKNPTYGAKKVDLIQLYKKSDFIIINCNLNKTNYHLLNKKAFTKMKPSVVIINVSRGSIIKESDLIWALKTNRIAGAALDVFEKEPLSMDSPLRKMKNVIISPHNANNSPYYWNIIHLNSIKNLLKELGT